MYYRFTANKRAFKDKKVLHHHEDQKDVIKSRMVELGLQDHRKHIEALMKKNELGDWEIEFWFTEQGFKEIGIHLGAYGDAFKWYKLPYINEDLIIFRDKYQVACRNLVVGRKNEFEPNPNDNIFQEEDEHLKAYIYESYK